MARPEKEATVEEVKEKLSGAKGSVLTDFRGLKVQELSELRKNLRDNGIEYKIYKNTLAKIAAKKVGFDELSVFLEGPTAFAFGNDDAITVAKILNDFAKSHAKLSLKAGIVEGKVLDADGIKAVANLPSRDGLIAQVVGMLQAPISGLAYVLNGPVSSIAVVLNRIAESKS